jgi:hypothetical protein
MSYLYATTETRAHFPRLSRGYASIRRSGPDAFGERHLTARAAARRGRVRGGVRVQNTPRLAHGPRPFLQRLAIGDHRLFEPRRPALALSEARKRAAQVVLRT